MLRAHEKKSTAFKNQKPIKENQQKLRIKWNIQEMKAKQLRRRG